MHKKIKIILVIIAFILIIGSLYYINDYYHAEKTATDYINGSKNVNLSKIDNALFVDGPGNDTALIFYPGAKIEYVSYLPMMVQLSKKGVDCYLVEMPFNLAILGKNSADSIIDSGNYTRYIMSGHSLGGAMAASYVNETNKSDGLIMFAAYSTTKISKPVLSIYGSEDKVLNLNAYNESMNLYDNFTEHVIDGGNHAQFGYYGNQSGDGNASISAKIQQNECVNEILEFITHLP